MISDGVEIYNWWLECCQGVPIGPPHTISEKIAIRDKKTPHIAFNEEKSRRHH